MKRNGAELAHFAFDGELVSLYWSPHESRVALNNHYGHRAWAVWIISLRDGSLIRADGKPKSKMSIPRTDKVVDYDRYLDDRYLPDATKFALKEIKAVYPEFGQDTDKRGMARLTIVHGWTDESKLKMFDEIELDRLYENEVKCLQIESLLTVKQTGLRAHPVSVEKATQNTTEGRSPEVVEVIGID